MENYINMNDSFGNKHSVSSTKSFRTYEDSIQALKEQLYNHQKALETAEKIVEQYQHENQQLQAEINELKQSKARTEQKYEVLQNLFIKLDKAKQKQLHKQTKRAHEKHELQIENLNAKYEQHISSLNQRIFFLELQLHKYQNQHKKYQNIIANLREKHSMQDMNHQNYFGQAESMFGSRTVVQKRNQESEDKSQDSLQKVYVKTSAKISSHSQIYDTKQPRNSIKSNTESRKTTKASGPLAEQLKKGQIAIGRESMERKKESRNSDYQEKGNILDRKPMRHSQVRVNTTEDYFTQKIQMIKNTNKPKNLIIYDNNFTDYKDYKERF